MDAPCENCKRREVGCHSKCSEYLQFREYKLQVNESRHIEVITTQFTQGHRKAIIRAKSYRQRLGKSK